MCPLHHTVETKLKISQGMRRSWAARKVAIELAALASSVK
jgi:hypothetical protein